MHELGKYLHAEITARGLTPAQFARQASLTRQNVYQLLDDKRTHLGRLPAYSTAERIADALGVSVNTVWNAALSSLAGPEPAPHHDPDRDEVMNYLMHQPADAVPDDILMKLLAARLRPPADELAALRALRVRAEDLLRSVELGATVTVHDMRRVLHGALAAPTRQDPNSEG